MTTESWGIFLYPGIGIFSKQSCVVFNVNPMIVVIYYVHKDVSYCGKFAGNGSYTFTTLCMLREPCFTYLPSYSHDSWDLCMDRYIIVTLTYFRMEAVPTLVAYRMMFLFMWASGWGFLLLYEELIHITHDVGCIPLMVNFYE